MTHASVFSGIGGPEIAAAMLGWDNVFHCEINPFGRKVLDYWFPKSKSYEDITKTDFTEWRGMVDVLTGGFPCQPFSYAGQRRGADDDRYLWPYMFKCIDQIRPDWVVAENVAGITTMVEQGEVFEMGGQATIFEEVDGLHRYQLRETFTLQRICDDLESHGYSVQPVLIPACAVGAPHRRDRVFIVARRIATDSNYGYEGGDSGENEGACGQKRLQKRDEIRIIGEPSKIRRETSRYMDAADTVDEGLQGRNDCDTKGHGQSSDGCTRQPCEIHGRERNVADTSGIGAGKREQAERKECGRTSIFEFRERYGASLSADGGVCGERWQNFPTVSPVHRGNDGLPFDVDGLSIPFSKWRTESLKAYGNAIVPQVMYEIFRAIELVSNKKQRNGKRKKNQNPSRMRG